ncbi:peptidase M16C associated-domain-containing protein [Cokeromyces recurvatus]|uniref:peptidase M16C associated-domain-containing protein n=1 Tax=Cokeromyces recurvatus TaxID=90255 RepID=UPI00221F1FB6|nr:peptidase M16C associated-domain-containing protein [Cokeromyces recurvatus]KAI7908289.1 peptidase M16C associated-domain-containing protein [Cokeromyces recurvatus]
MSTQLKLSSRFFQRGVRYYASKAILTPGQKLQGYEVQQVRKVPELELTAITLQHEITGARHLHIDREDSNNVFAVGFHTPVQNDTGVPHILEHTTLCGSQKYPVRDPFFKMLNRSLATFMNAFTASDYTIYPFATTNPADYNNLRDVYMDAVFHPKLNRLDFKQEGWRLEHEIPTDTSTPIQFKGVVYNEMKGQSSDINYLYYIRMQQAMFAGTTYEYCSGGDPKFITDLTHEQLLDFHKRHYHPSNARFYTYGNFPLEEHLEAISKQLEGFTKSQVTIPNVNKITTSWNEPKSIETTCPLDPMSPPDRQTKLSISYLTNDVTDTFETFSMRLLSYLLLDGHASPFYKALIETNLGSEFSSNTGYDNSTRTSSLSIGLQGVKDDDVEKVKITIKNVLEKVRQEGFDSKRIEAAIHQMELAQKHKTADFGLTIMHGISSGWFNEVDPVDLLEINKHIERLKSELSKGNYFEHLIDKYLLNNKHTLSFVMRPDEKYSATVLSEEKSRLAKKVESLTDKEKAEIAQDGKDLLASQDRKEDLSCLPTLQLSDIAHKAKHTILEHTGLCNTPVQWRTTSTNGITYFRAISTLPSLSDDLKLYLPLFCDALLSLGTRQQSMADIDEEIRLYTGGLRASTTLTTNHSDIDHIEEGIALVGNCLDRNIDKMYSILAKLIHETNFDDVEKLKTLINGNASSMVNSIADSGHVFARTFAGSSLTPGMHNAEIMSGMTQVKFMSRLAAQEDISDVVTKLKQIASAVLTQSSLRVAITSGEDAIESNTKSLISFLQSLPVENNKINNKSTMSLNTGVFTPQYKRTFFPLPFQVNFSAQVFRGVPYTHPDGASLQMLSSLMTNHYLHREIREKNGAYGGGASYAGLNGLFSFYSYRDPRTLETLDTFKKSIDWVQQRSFTDQEMTESKLSIFQGIDAPQSVSEEGMLQFVHGISDEMRQWRREALLKVTQDDIKRVAFEYLDKHVKQNGYSTALLGESNNRITEEQGWHINQWDKDSQEQ